VRRSDLDGWLGSHRIQPANVAALDVIVRDILEGVRRGR
jgi:hypothetical protein